MPNTKDNFWTDELVIEFMDYFKKEFGKGFPRSRAIIYFKNYIQPKDIKDIPFETTVNEILSHIRTGGMVELKLIELVKSKLNV